MASYDFTRIRMVQLNSDDWSIGYVQGSFTRSLSEAS